MNCVIGVDAGGTKTVAVAYTPEGERLAAFEAGPGNVTAAGDEAMENICTAVAGCIAAAGCPCLFIGVGMAGLDPGNTPQRLRALLKARFGAESAVVSDGELALTAAHGSDDGLLVIAGTGSIAYGRRGGAVLRRGGWGHVLGDRGSGYAIAADAIRLALEDLDGGGPEDPLTLRLMERLGTSNLRGLVEHVYNRPKAETAAMASVVAELQAAGDKRATAILTRAGEDLAELALGLSTRLTLLAPRVALAGGILENVTFVREQIIKKLREELPEAVILEGKVEAQRGALELSRSPSRSHSPSSP